jgi:hypothetical protein
MIESVSESRPVIWREKVNKAALPQSKKTEWTEPRSLSKPRGSAAAQGVPVRLGRRRTSVPQNLVLVSLLTGLTHT